MNERVSIIIPVYNVQDYLEKCLESIIKQTYSNIEIILVNDGSTDKSLSICQKYAEKDSRIIIISQENQGVSAARNNGFQNSHGNFVTFVDSDDYIEQDYIEHLMSGISENIDLVCCDLPKNIAITERKLNDKVQMAKLFSEFGYTWGKLIRKSCIDCLFHPNMNYAEDFFFYISLLENLRTIVILEYWGYHYQIRMNSLSCKDKNQKRTMQEFENKNTFVLCYQENLKVIQKYDINVKRIINSHCYYIFCLLILLIYRMSRENIIVEKTHLDLILKFMRQNYWSFFKVVIIQDRNWKRFAFGTALLLLPKYGAKLSDQFLE